MTGDTYDCEANGGEIVVVDFDDFDGGALVSRVTDFLTVTAYKYPDNGEYFTPICKEGGVIEDGGPCELINNAAGGFARVFDSSNPTGGDVDLGSPNVACPGCTPETCPGKGEGGKPGLPGANCVALGKLLIVTEFEGPPDDAVGAQLRFEFNDPEHNYQFLSAGIVDIEEISVTLGLIDGTDSTTVTQDGLGDNAFQVLVNPNPEKVLSEFDIDFKGSGAVSDLKFCKKVAITEPLPIGINIEKLIRVEKEWTPGSPAMPNDKDEDVDEATGPEACIGDRVVFTSVVTNTGDVPLCDITVTTSDNPAIDNPINHPDYVLGDTNNDNCLDLTETWVYVQSRIVDSSDLGKEFERIDTVEGTDLVGGRKATDADPVYYIAQCPPTPPPTEAPTAAPTAPLLIDIEKLVRVEKQETSGTGDVCDLNDIPRSLTFEYQPSEIITNLQEGKAEFKIKKQSDGDCSAFAMVGGESDTKKVVEELTKFEKGERSTLDKVFGYKTVSCGDVFEAKRSNGGDFPGTSYFYFFTSKPTLTNWQNLIFQQIKFESGCGKPLNFGDQFGSGKLTCYRGKDDNAATEYCLPKPMSPVPDPTDDDADEPTGPEACPGDMVVFTSIVTNPNNVPLCNIQVTTSADLNVDEDPTFVSGDENGDGCLDPTETWIYVQSKIAGPSDLDSQAKGTDTVVGTSKFDARTATDSDDVHYFGKCPLPPLPENGFCDVCGKPTLMTWTYIPSNTDATFQGSKSILIGQADDDDEAFIVVADDTVVSNLKGSSPSANIYFRGALTSGDTFETKPNYLGISGQDTDKFNNQMFFMVFDSENSFNNGAQPIQIGDYHSSCSAPIVPGAVLGSFVLGIPYVGENNCGYPSFPTNPQGDSPTSGADLCPTCGKPELMTWTYMPSTTDATFQGSKSMLVGVADDDDQAFVVVADESQVSKLQGFSPEANIYFRGVLNKGDTFETKPNYLGLSSGQDTDKFNNNVIFMVFDSEEAFNLGAQPLQMGDYHASCSAPIIPGAVLGSFILGTEYVGQNSCGGVSSPQGDLPLSGDGLCEVCGKPKLMTWVYEPSATDATFQASKSVLVGLPDDDLEAFVVVADEMQVSKLQGNSPDANIYFRGVLNAGDTFETKPNYLGISGQDTDKFNNNVIFMVFDSEAAFNLGAEPLQIGDYHASCSAPIIPGAVLGSFTLATPYVGQDCSYTAPSAQ